MQQGTKSGNPLCNGYDLRLVLFLESFREGETRGAQTAVNILSESHWEKIGGYMLKGFEGFQGPAFAGSRDSRQLTTFLGE